MNPSSSKTKSKPKRRSTRQRLQQTEEASTSSASVSGSGGRVADEPVSLRVAYLERARELAGSSANESWGTRSTSTNSRGNATATVTSSSSTASSRESDIRMPVLQGGVESLTNLGSGPLAAPVVGTGRVESTVTCPSGFGTLTPTSTTVPVSLAYAAFNASTRVTRPSGGLTAFGTIFMPPPPAHAFSTPVLPRVMQSRLGENVEIRSTTGLVAFGGPPRFVFSTLFGGFRGPSAITSESTSLKMDSTRTPSFAGVFEHFCNLWTPAQVNHRSIRGSLGLLVDKIFADNEERYNVFVTEATICATSSPQMNWRGPSVEDRTGRLEYRQFFQFNGSAYVLYIFDRVGHPLEFKLDYMHPKFKAQQLEPEIFARSSGRNEARGLILLRSTNGVTVYSYWKNYVFHPICTT